MAASFGFSIGDFIAGINLIIKSINAIQDGTGSSSEYRAVTATLSAVASALDGLNQLNLEDSPQRHTLEVAASKCGQTIFQFLNKIGKYEKSLGTKSPPQKWEAALRKIHWALYSKEDIRHFQAILQADLLSLQITMTQVHISLTTNQATETRSGLNRITQILEQASIIQQTELILQALTRCYSDVRALFMIVLLGNMRILDFLYRGSQLPLQVQDERPVYLNDPHDRVIPFPRCWINDWDDLITMLKIQFKDVPGLRKIKSGQFALEDSLRRTEITPEVPIQTVFLPGRTINMSMIFNLSNTISRCPGDISLSTPHSGSDIECASCGLAFSKDRRDWKSIVLPFSKYEPTTEVEFGHVKKRDLQESIYDFSRVKIVVPFKHPSYAPLDKSNYLGRALQKRTSGGSPLSESILSLLLSGSNSLEIFSDRGDHEDDLCWVPLDVEPLNSDGFLRVYAGGGCGNIF